VKYLESFDFFITEDSWKEKFEMPMDVYLKQYADENLMVFMELGGITNLNTISPLKNSQ
jgi:hypothetical protein